MKPFSVAVLVFSVLGLVAFSLYCCLGETSDVIGASSFLLTK